MSILSNGPFYRIAELAQIDELIITRCLVAPLLSVTNIVVGLLTATSIVAQTITAGEITTGVLKVDTFGMRELNVPAINTTPQNNLVIAGLGNAMLIRFQLTGGPGTISVTGIDKPAPTLGGYSRMFIFLNRGTSSKTLQLEDENAGSMPSNRFMNHGSVARAIPPGEARQYFYDEGGQRWTEVS